MRGEKLAIEERLNCIIFCVQIFDFSVALRFRRATKEPHDWRNYANDARRVNRFFRGSSFSKSPKRTTIMILRDCTIRTGSANWLFRSTLVALWFRRATRSAKRAYFDWLFGGSLLSKSHKKRLFWVALWWIWIWDPGMIYAANWVALRFKEFSKSHQRATMDLKSARTLRLSESFTNIAPLI